MITLIYCVTFRAFEQMTLTQVFFRVALDTGVEGRRRLYE
jgi:hypothetical protein